ncbi:MAG: hypothetical protein J0G29_00055 [Alphaproteobacteria bacterium]|nr:hypothetical protein [Alphaproteobacteria bacterium]OJV45796.1 MAG: hypothetical protein BGO28_06220 [Alphaproteobacteria bacterium 43-37]
MKIDSVRFKTITSKKRTRKVASGDNFSLFDLAPIATQTSVSTIQPTTHVGNVLPVQTSPEHKEHALIDYAESVLDNLHLLNLAILGYGDSVKTLMELHQKLLNIPNAERSIKLNHLIEMIELRGHVELAKRGMAK